VLPKNLSKSKSGDVSGAGSFGKSDPDPDKNHPDPDKNRPDPQYYLLPIAAFRKEEKDKRMLRYFYILFSKILNGYIEMKLCES
jgi:hypothetical protein